VDGALVNQVIEAKLDEEDRVIAAVTGATLEYMYRHGLAHERRLRNHSGNLSFDAVEEHDLFEAMRLAERLSAVHKNIRGASRRNERLRSEIVRREADRSPSFDRRAWRLPLYIGGERWYERAVGDSDSVAGGG